MTLTLRTGLLTCAFCCALLAPSPAIPEQVRQKQSEIHGKPRAEDRVDINSAPLHELLKVPGMTPTWAARIIRFRPYRAKNELIDRGVVSQQVYARIKDYIIAHHANQ